MYLVDLYVFILKVKSTFISYGKSILHRAFSVRNPLHVYKVVKYNLKNDDETDMTHAYTKGVHFKLADSDYLEIRVQWLDQQYRYLVNETMEFPTYFDFSAQRRLHILYAVLVNKREFVYTDVMDRVQKFIGRSTKPFFGKTIICRQIFMNDDLTDDHELHIVTKDGRLLQFSVDEVINLKKSIVNSVQ
jgi:hypothetical protein|tara:strand:+ start:1630 stop:2196 length:567 start_codon:yes stop_codon:yes gene_type:complete